MNKKHPSSQNSGDRNPPASNRQLLILLGFFVVAIAGTIWAFGWVFDSFIEFIPPSLEQKLGAVIVPVYEQIAQPSEAQDTLNTLLDGLETHLPEEQRQNRDYRVLFVPEDTVNALALPGDAIVVYGGLLQQAESENELMMVLGHELGHFANRDHLRGLGQQLLLRVTIASIFGDTGALAGIIGSTIETISRSQYSQSQELQADEFGIDLLQKHYTHVAGATDFFARLDREKKSNLAFFSTHPAPRNRVKKLEKILRDRQYPIGEKAPLPPALSEWEPELLPPPN
ncbi:M48 family metallopeptidase [Oscillatoriales cyanobacterium LEGE 11467]|uniref:M48 family metallopeptidase n=1 Tax=Zarconia navalis LEGE 11467 TaxID=1828826 RepID=A0A928Z981_9CYAN|nr:M48 family metallopeptidase [Zarconia navalis]MBE9041438.1 M48 family metallopeptidase [Zarconia navalis LEGE 11467]